MHHHSRVSALVVAVFIAAFGAVSRSHTPPRTSAATPAAIARSTAVPVVSHAPGASASSAAPRQRPAAGPQPADRRGSVSRVSYDLNLGVARRNHTATVLADGKVLFVGGENTTGAVSAVELLDPASGAISHGRATAIARSGHTATLLANGTVLVAGGSNAAGALASTEIYDPGTKRFSRGPILQRARVGHTATTLGDGRVLIAGGNADQSAEILDPRAGAFTLVASRTTVPRSFHSAIRLQDGDVLLVGGLGFYNGDTAELFSPTGSTFTATINWLQVNRVRPRLQLLLDGRVQIVGGDAAGSIETYVPASKRFRNYARLTAEDALPAAQAVRPATWTAVIDGAMSNASRVASARTSDARPAATGDGPSLDAIARADYTYSRIDSLGLAVVAGGLDRHGAFLQSVLVFPSSTAIVSTDRVEYPLETNDFVVATDPMISGSGWAPGEVVTVTRQGSQSGRRVVLTAEADAEGRFSIKDQPTQTSGIDVYVLTASGRASGYVAQNTYRIAPSPDKAMIEKYKGVKPTRIKARIPITGESGTFQTDAGPLHWRVTPEKGVTLRRATQELSPAPSAAQTVQPMYKADSFEALDVKPTFDYQWDLFHFDASWTEVPLPPDIPGVPNPLPDGLTITSTGSLTNGRGYIEIESKWEGPECHCCWCWPPCSCSLATATISAAFVVETDVQVTNDFSFEGEVAPFGDPILVYPIVKVTGEIPNTGFGFDINAGLYLGLNIETSGPITVRTVFEADALRVKTGIEGGISLAIPIPKFGVWPLLALEAGDVRGSAKLLEFGGIEIKPALMAGFDAELSLGEDLPIIDCTAKIAAGAKAGPYLNFDIGPKEGLDPAVCQKYDFALKAGLRGEAGASLSCGIVSGSIGGVLESPEIVLYDPDWGELLFKDPAPPTVTPSADITVPADAGLCTAALNVPNAAVFDVCTAATVSGVRSDALALGALYPIGITTITWDGADGGDPPNHATAIQKVTVKDVEPPQVGPVTASETALWPPNHGMREVKINYDVSDRCSQPAASLIVSSNEPVNGVDDGDTAPDWEVVDAHTVRLRAERSGTGSGRIYTITVKVVDGSGNSSLGTVQVAVPVNRGR